MATKVEMMIQVSINGRPTWRKLKVIKPEMSFRMTDKEYASVLTVATTELAQQIKTYRAKQEKEPAV